MERRLERDGVTNGEEDRRGGQGGQSEEEEDERRGERRKEVRVEGSSCSLVRMC